MCLYRLLGRENLTESQIVYILDDIPYHSDISGASDDSVADETYQPLLEQPDVETSDNDNADEGGEDKVPVIPEDVNDLPGTSGGVGTTGPSFVTTSPPKIYFMLCIYTTFFYFPVTKLLILYFFTLNFN